MGKRLLSVMLALLMVVSLLPMSAMANGEDGITVETGCILIGATREENGTLSPKTNSNVTYAITQTSDETYTLTFSGNGEIPDYYTENQGYTNDGTEIYKVNGTWQNKDGVSDGFSEGPVNTNGTYRWCTYDRAYYRSTQWDDFNTEHKDAITKVVFEEDITGIGQFTLFNMTGVTEVVIENPNCDISNNAVYFNSVNSPGCTITVDSKAYKDNIVGYYKMAEENKGEISYSISDAVAFANEKQNLLSLNDAQTNKADILAAYEEYMEGNEVFRDAVDSASVTVGGGETTTFGAAFAAVYKEVTGTDPSNIVLQGNVQDSTVMYELTKNEDGDDTLTLRFYDPTGNGQMPDFAIKDTDPNKLNDIDRYQNAPWYASQYRNNITHVIYDESITRTSYLSAAHMYNCTQFDFLNDDVEIVNATIHYNDSIKAESVTLRYSGDVGNANSIVSYRHEADKAKVTVSYLEIEDFLNRYGNLFAQSTIDDQLAATLKAAFESLPTACKVRLGIDTVPDTETTYRDKLDDLLEAAGSGPVDDSETIKSGVVPSDDPNETVHYEITTTDNETYTVRFYDVGGDGRIPNYAVRITSDSNTSNPNAWDAYERLPWRDGYQSTMVKYIFDESITDVGQFVAANMSACVEYEFQNPNVTTHVNAIYYNGVTNAPDESVTIHAYSSADINIGYRDDATEASVGSRIHYSYYEAEQFEANAQYASLWTLSEADAEKNSNLIQQAYRDYNNFADVVKHQLDTDTIGTTTTTYADKLEALMAKLNLGGSVSVGSDVKYTLSLNEDNSTYTLNLSGSGEVKLAGNAPWNSNATSITDVVLGEGITGVAAGTFTGLTKLKSVNVAKSVKTIAEGAFPNSNFEMYGWLNHASGKYADENTGVQLRLKDLRILAIGNSHTSDYTEFFFNILNDLDESVATNINYRVLASGGRGLYIEQGERSSHYHAATTEGYTSESGLDYSDYQAAFDETWDIVIIQDYHESTKDNGTYGGENYTDEMQIVIAWLKTEVPGAKIAWFADWAEGVNGMSNLSRTYQLSVYAMNAINALSENKPDFIIPASTVLQNARTTYLGTTKNDKDALVNWDGNFNDFAKGELQNYSLLERDSTHMSLELGRQLMGTFVLYSIFQQYADEIVTDEDFNFFENLVTAPEYTYRDCYWNGEFTEDIWAIIKESCEHAWTTKNAVTSTTSYTTDPFTTKYESVKNIISEADKSVDKSQISQTYLEDIFKSDDVLNELANIVGLNITADDVTVTYTAPEAGTLADPTGKDGGYTVIVDCHYGYSYPTEDALTVNIPASQAPGADEALQEIKEQAIEKLNSYMSNDSYAEGTNRQTVVKAKEDGENKIEAAGTATAVQVALLEAEGAIDSVETIFGAQYHTGGNCVEYGQIWTGGWDYSEGFINKNSYTMDIEGNATTYDSVFTGVWWVVFKNDDGSHRIEFFKDSGTGYTFETPVYNPSHWLDPLEHKNPSHNPLQYNQTPWFKEYRSTLTKAIVHSGVTINQHTLACYPNISEYVIEDGANLGTNAIYFNPLQVDTTVTFEGSSTVERDAVSGYRVANSYEHYIDVYGNLSEVTISSSDSNLNGKKLEDNLYYVFGKYNDIVQAWVAEAQVYETIATGIAGAGEADVINGFAPHYTDGVPDGTTMLRVFNTDETHTHRPVILQATAGTYPCQTGLSEGSFCSDCKAIITPQKVIVGNEDHTWTAVVTKQPSATDRGEITYTCEGCSATKIEYTGRVQVGDENDAVSVNGSNYSSLDYAISQAEPGDVVVLLKDIAQNVVVEAGQEGIIVDLNGHTFTGNITVSGSIIIQSTGNGKIDGIITESEGGKVQVLSGTYTNDPSSFCTEDYGAVKNGDNIYTVHKHNWGDGVVTTPPSSTSDGVKTFTCSICQATKTETLPSHDEPEPDPEPFTITIVPVTHGEVTADKTTAAAGETVTLTVDPDSGYRLADLTVKDGSGTELELEYIGNGKYTFEMPESAVTVDADFTRITSVRPPVDEPNEPEEPEEPEGPHLPFIDVTDSDWFYDAVEYAYTNGLMDGVSMTQFSPNSNLTRGMVVTILYRLEDGPRVTGSSGFTDVTSGAWYADAVTWAAANGIVNGVSDSEFAPNTDITREQLAAILFRYAEYKGYDVSGRDSLTSYTDRGSISAYALDAMQWAVDEGLITGMTATTIDPQGTATRAQCATMLMRFIENVA